MFVEEGAARRKFALPVWRSSCFVSLSNAAPDPLLSSLILPLADEVVSSQPQFLTESQPRKAQIRLYQEECYV